MATTKKTCARCGRQMPADRMVFSSWTRNHYCTDVDACGRRAARAIRASASIIPPAFVPAGHEDYPEAQE